MSAVTWQPGLTMAALEREVILAAFRFYDGNKTATARALDLDIKTISTRLEKYADDDVKAEAARVDEVKKAEELLAKHRMYIDKPVETSSPFEQDKAVKRVAEAEEQMKLEAARAKAKADPASKLTTQTIKGK